jgi:hypothetical protein
LSIREPGLAKGGRSELWELTILFPFKMSRLLLYPSFVVFCSLLPFIADWLYTVRANLLFALLWVPFSRASSGVLYIIALFGSRRTRHSLIKSPRQSRGFTFFNYFPMRCRYWTFIIWRKTSTILENIFFRGIRSSIPPGRKGLLHCYETVGEREC